MTASEKGKDMSDPIQRLLDKEEIRDVLYRMCRAVDRLDDDLLASLYHPGAMEDHGGYFGDADGFRASLHESVPNFYQRVHHTLGAINIELDGDVAHTESYFMTGGPLVGEGPTRVRTIYGRYVDEFERRDGEWRITQRLVVKDWTDIHEIVDPPDEYPLSRFGREDPVYTRTTKRLSDPSTPRQSRLPSVGS